MIDIIIPAYNAHDFIENALSSILIQTKLSSLHVYIVNDCSDKDYSEQINKYKDKMNIIELKTPKNVGPGGARSYGLDHSNGEFVVFIDADDIFSGTYSIEDMINNIDDADYIVTDFMEIVGDNSYIHYDNDVWMHGKMYRRSFLDEYNIRFNNTSANEDTGFNTLVLMCSKKRKYVDYLTYIWRYNDNSITRKNNHEFEFSGLKGFIDNICWAAKEAEKRNIEENIIGKIVYESILEIYYNYIKFYNNDKKDELLKWCIELKELYLKYIDKLNDQEKEECENKIVEKGIKIAGSYAVIQNKISFYDFLDKIFVE